MTRTLAAVAVILCLAPGAPGAAARAIAGMVPIPAGSYPPLIGGPRTVGAFDLDARPVTNGEYLAFVRAHPEWRRSRVVSLFADEAYLRQWHADLEPGANAALAAPVVSVSWYAARAYLATQHKQLPTVDQWEYAARQRQVRGLPSMVGRLQEWTLDFNASLVTGDARRDSALDRAMFCGGAALGASDTRDYAAFQRLAFRASLEARYSISNLGFRGVRAAGRGPALPYAAWRGDPASIFALDVPLVDQDGKTIRLADLAGHPLVATMGYTQCTAVCPSIVAEMKSVERELGPRAGDVRFVLLSLDPARDSPEALRRFAEQHHLDLGRWRLLAAGDEHGVRDLAAVLGVKYAPASGGVAHSAMIVVVDRQGVVRHRQIGVGQARQPLLEAVQAIAGPRRP